MTIIIIIIIMHTFDLFTNRLLNPGDTESPNDIIIIILLLLLLCILLI